jgi:hypothetical protein
MEFFRAYTDTWVIPQMCCVCGEPVVDGKPFGTSVTLSRTMSKAGTLKEIDVVNTTTASMSFPRCAACERAQKAKERSGNVTGAIGLLVGFTGCVYAASANGGWLPWVIFVAVWFAIAYGVQTLMDRRWARTADEDTQRRAKLSMLPVQIKKIGKSSFVPMLKFTFANDDYGKTFSALNP